MPSRAEKKSDGIKEKKVIKLDKQNTGHVKPVRVYDPEDIIFALDIGTRTVVGIVGIQDGEVFKVIAAEILEHKSRAMLDGQIHDIGQVEAVVGEIRKRLEKKVGFELKRVAIAAAGRVLKTYEVKVEREIDQTEEIDFDLVSSLEIEGIQLAQMKLDEEDSNEEKTQFYCVGYSVINYYLNGYIISKLQGHKGRKIAADILATFLPHVVVDSLYTVMNRIGLEVVSLTLEPIAALNVTIPRDLRLLNLALVDIGAGTSDIAITRDGTVVAYAMAPIAGDEITERIAQHYLVDFNTAERIKIAISTEKENIGFADILGNKQSATPDEALEVIVPAMELLAETISQKILEYNHKAPNAVFLIGGGSQTPGLAERISEHLKLPKERVVVRGRSIIQNVKFSGKKLSGPEAITPFGIAVTAQMQKGSDFLSVVVNGQKIRLFNSKRLTVADALMLIGFNPRQLIGRSGKSISFKLNGERKYIRGEYGKAAEILANGKAASLDTQIRPGDNISISQAEDGKNAEVKISDFIGGEEKVKEYDIVVNSQKIDYDYSIKENDIIEWHEKVISESNPANVEYGAADDNSNANDKGVVEDINAVWVTVNGSKIVLKGNKAQYIFVDIFSYINFDLSKPQGSIILKLNGRQAAFTDEIRRGDTIDIYWDK